jgi:eukaryotic-like serine/threonine-protein kinase
VWSYTTGAPVFSSPAVANGVVYVGSEDDNVYTFGLSGGSNSVQRPVPTALKPDMTLTAVGTA